MNSYPKDPIMLLSWVNLKLRDFYPSLENLCEDLDIDPADLIETLEKAGYVYICEQNRFW